MPISRTICQRTCCQRRRPAPTPTTDEATTWVVLTGAPIREAPRITAVDEVWLVKESMGWYNAPADGPDDAPTAQGGAHRERDAGGDLGPQRHRHGFGLAGGQQQHRDDAHGLLGVVAAVTEGQARGHDPAAAAHRTISLTILTLLITLKSKRKISY